MAQYKILIQVPDFEKILLLHQHSTDSEEQREAVESDALPGQSDEDSLQLIFVKGHDILTAEMQVTLEVFLGFQAGLVHNYPQSASVRLRLSLNQYFKNTLQDFYCFLITFVPAVLQFQLLEPA